MKKKGAGLSRTASIQSAIWASEESCSLIKGSAKGRSGYSGENVTMRPLTTVLMRAVPSGPRRSAPAFVPQISAVLVSYHQTGAKLIKDGKLFRIPRNQQHSQAKKAGLDYAP